MRNGAWWAAAEILYCEGTREKTIGRCLLLHHIDLYNSESFFLHDHKRVVIYSTRWYVDLESSEPANKREVHLSLNCSWLVIKITIGRFKSKGIMQSKKKLPGDTMDVIPWVSIKSITYRTMCKWAWELKGEVAWYWNWQYVVRFREVSGSYKSFQSEAWQHGEFVLWQ